MKYLRVVLHTLVTILIYEGTKKLMNDMYLQDEVDTEEY